MELKERLVRLYFEAGYSYSLILKFLANLHGICLSLRTFKRLLRRYGLRRRGCNSDLNLVMDCIEVIKVASSVHNALAPCKVYDVMMYMQTELEQSGSLLGYRAMHLRLIQMYQLRMPRLVESWLFMRHYVYHK